MAGSITSTNAQFLLSIPGVYGAPQALQGFSADDIFTINDTPPTEAVMGVTGELAAGAIFVPMVQGISLLASSISNDVFDNWRGAMRNLGDVIFCQGIVTLLSVGKEYTLVNGTLTGYKPIADARRTLQARAYQITWERVDIGNV